MTKVLKLFCIVSGDTENGRSFEAAREKKRPNENMSARKF